MVEIHRIMKICNCRVKNDCPLDGTCLSGNVIYRAAIIRNNSTKYDTVQQGVNEEYDSIIIKLSSITKSTKIGQFFRSTNYGLRKMVKLSAKLNEK